MESVWPSFAAAGFDPTCLFAVVYSLLVAAPICLHPGSLCAGLPGADLLMTQSSCGPVMLNHLIHNLSVSHVLVTCHMTSCYFTTAMLGKPFFPLSFPQDTLFSVTLHPFILIYSCLTGISGGIPVFQHTRRYCVTSESYVSQATVGYSEICRNTFDTFLVFVLHKLSIFDFHTISVTGTLPLLMIHPSSSVE